MHTVQKRTWEDDKLKFHISDDINGICFFWKKQSIRRVPGDRPKFAEHTCSAATTSLGSMQH